ncbi:MAG: hypothetical protein JOZ44_03000 [Acidobacteria bacterium]|nr:hypothetical protein [Acidobacteriota bacterium]
MIILMDIPNQALLQTEVTSPSDAASTSLPATAQASFEVRFKEFDNVYLRVPPGALLSKGMKLLVRRRSPGAAKSDLGEIVAELRIRSVSPSSAICEILMEQGDFEKGDFAYLTAEESAALTKQQTLKAASSSSPSPRPEQPLKSKSIAEESQSMPLPKSQNEKPSIAGVEGSTTIQAVVLQSSSGMQPAGAAARPSSSKGLLPAQSDIRQVQSGSSGPSPLPTQAIPSTRSASASIDTKIGVLKADSPMNGLGVISGAASAPPASAQPSNSPSTDTPSPVGGMHPIIAAGAPSINSIARASESNSRTSPNLTAAVQPPVAMKAQSLQSSQAEPARAAQSEAALPKPAVIDVQSASGKPPDMQQSSAQPAGLVESELALPSDESRFADVQTIFKIKFVAQDTVYLSGGTATGLTAGMNLTVKHSELDVTHNGTLAKASQAPVIAELQVISVASSSAVCAIKTKTADIEPGDLAFMDRATAEMLAEKHALSATRKYPQVVSFNDGDPMEEEAREEVPRPPLPEINRIRGRFGFDYSDIQSTGAVTSNSSQLGMVVRTDFSRIGGTYWDLSGYWRGRLNSTSNAEQPTLQDLINRTYHLNLTYSNPTSSWVAGFGRLYLPWATTLDTIDGGYVGRRAGKHVLLGLFAGSTPDPTSWDYNPNRRLGGIFLNLEGGSFDSLRMTSTSGVALSTLNWQVDRPFIFFENGLYFKRYLSIYDSTQADDPRPIAGLNAVGPGLSRNFFTLRFQPFERLSFDVNHNYFRDVPTFDTALIATGLLDKYLFQGLSTGARVEPIRHITFYASVGKSSRTGDTGGAWNEMYGVTLNQIPKTGLRLDVRTSTFDSSFGHGRYRSVSISRNLSDAFHLEMQVGQQFLTSQLTSQTESRFINASVDSNLGANYFIQGAYTVDRGGAFNYNQWTITFGYRFDNRTGAGR